MNLLWKKVIQSILAVLCWYVQIQIKNKSWMHRPLSGSFVGILRVFVTVRIASGKLNMGKQFLVYM